MAKTYNIYTDESCHLPNDGMPFMIQGAVICPSEKAKEANKRLYEIREKHGLPRPYELKWVGVSPSKIDYYREIVDYFFDDDDLSFRAVVADKSSLDHGRYNQTHDDWYYKMMYQLHTRLVLPGNVYRIYLDKKDTRSEAKTKRLQDVLANTIHDFDRRIVTRVQVVQSHEIGLLQLSDLLLGGIGYVARGLKSSQAKLDLIDRIRERSGVSLKRSTLLREEKFNVFYWEGRR